MLTKNHMVLLCIAIVGIILALLVSKIGKEKSVGVSTKCTNFLPDLNNASFPLPTDLEFEGVSTDCLSNYVFNLMKLASDIYVPFEMSIKESGSQGLRGKLEEMADERDKAYHGPINDVILRDTSPETPYEIKERMIKIRQIKLLTDWLNTYHDVSDSST